MDKATNQLVINADLPQGKINKNIYGHFAEHLGWCIYGGFWVGLDSEIPHTRGIRKDAVAALRNLNIPVLRWPGGCFADEYHWRDGIGPRDERPGMVNTHWGGVTESNHFGTHEFMDLCEMLDCEPYICGNLGSGTVQEMQQWVEYLTCSEKSSMTELRKRNGREKPWHVRYWGVGNENWACGGNMRPQFYADQYRRYATYCRNFGDNKLYKIACGAAGDDYTWTEVLMRDAGHLMDGLSLHHYTLAGTWADKGSATDFDEEDWFTIMAGASHFDELITRHSAIMDRYDPEKRVGLVVDEWGTWYDREPGTPQGFLYQQNTLRDALSAGLSLNIFNSHCGRIHMANIAQTANVLQAMILTDKEKLILTPTYHVFEMYKVHQDADLLPAELSCGNYTWKDKSVPALSVSASRDKEGGVNLSLCHLNPHEAARVSCELRGMNPAGVSGRVLTGEEMNARNTFAEPGSLQPRAFDGAKLNGNVLDLILPAKSVVVLKII